MKHMPISVPALGPTLFVSVEPRLDQEGKQRLRDGVPEQTTHILIQPENGKPEVIDVNVPSMTPLAIAQMTPVSIENLTASQWSIDGRAGITMRADAIRPSGTPVPASIPVPADDDEFNQE
ncbi:hypothetical protein CS006_07375 [Bifidobacterium primatium]|uniref:Uncharacterized protein n=1 Tax=Bifidobacterium primatium TaxID=2045438 RepID=A0A2M9H8C5_9BIFI|nr:hypothetical protein [Bifidobacterium primatium]PJM73059.1 hypothetical protein CS006_07375 [Bifidobacterium primatium]